MSLETLLSLPAPPLFQTSWPALQSFDWVRALRECPQDPIHHAEGDVWIHTQMVLDVLASMPAFRTLPLFDQQALWLGCLLHDVAKPQTTREEEGRITAKGHSRAGELLARRILWELNLPFALREMVCGLIRYHQIPFYLIERDDAQRVAAELSFSCRADLLAMVAEADIRGRICQDLNRVLDNIELFRTFCMEENCYTQARPFASDHTRVIYFASEGHGRVPDVPVYDDTKGEMIVMVGLPGSGKDSYIKAHYSDLPVVSLDDLRAEMHIDPTDNQGTVVQEGRERLKEHLRRGERFVYNATNINRQRRGPALQLALDYKAKTKIVYIESSREQMLAQNRLRAGRVPEAVIARMSERWEVPRLTEAHQVKVVLR